MLDLYVNIDKCNKRNYKPKVKVSIEKRNFNFNTAKVVWEKTNSITFLWTENPWYGTHTLLTFTKWTVENDR